MLPTPEPAQASAPRPSDSRSDSAITALYRAVLGPVNASYYLPIFARFDEAGRTTTGWNWAAGLFTLGWMVFRQLWGPALVYVAVAEGVALLVFGVGRPMLHWPQGVEWGVLAALVLLCCAVPGLYGNALLHTDAHKKIARALTATHTLNEACALLARQASSWRRLAWLAAAHVALLLAAAGAYFANPAQGVQGASSAAQSLHSPGKTASAGAAPTDLRSAGPGAAPPRPPASAQPALAAAASTPALSGSAPLLPGPASSAASVPTSAVAPLPESASMATPNASPEARASSPPQPSAAAAASATGVHATPTPTSISPAPEHRPSIGKASKTADVPRVQPAPIRDPAKPRAPTKEQTPGPGTTAPASHAAAPLPNASRTDARQPRPAPTEAITPNAAPQTAQASADATPPASPAASSVPAMDATASAPAANTAATVGTAPGYYINVGVFADEANARKAQARLLNEGFPAFRQEFFASQKRRLRVRVGPFERPDDAEAAAVSVRALGLEAVVARQGR
jgi:cell division septation protein DedD